MEQNFHLIRPSNSDLESKIIWLETLLHEIANQGNNLWQSPYFSMMRLPGIYEDFLETIKKHLPNGVCNSSAIELRRIVKELSMIANLMEKQDNLPVLWMATLWEALLTLEDLKRDAPDCSTVEDLRRRCRDLLKKSSLPEMRTG